VLLLDGHNRYTICQRLGLPYDIVDVEDSDLTLETRYDAMDWIINNQLERRNLSLEQRSYLRGKRYNQEKKAEGRPDKLSDNRKVSGATHERLAKTYRVAPSTITADGNFAEAVDTLETIKPGVRSTVLQPATNGATKVTKKQATHAGKLVQKRTVEPQPRP
jgi:hypothetical protein